MTLRARQTVAWIGLRAAGKIFTTRALVLLCTARRGRAVARPTLLGVAARAALSVCAVASHAHPRTRLRAVAQVLAATAATFHHKRGRAHAAVPSGTSAAVGAGAVHAAFSVCIISSARRARSRAASGAVHQIVVRTAHACRSAAIACAALGLGTARAARAIGNVAVLARAEAQSVARAA